jgi:exosortase
MPLTVESPLLEGLETSERSWQSWIQVSLLAALLALLYHHILAALAVQWWEDPNYSHGFFVPFFGGWIVWKERKRILAEPVNSSWWGLLVVLGGLGILVLGVLGAELFLSRTSFLIVIAGLIIQFQGWRRFRSMLFPWAVLFLMIPLPVIIFNQIALPLQFLASRLASGLLSLVGVPVLREGNVINLPSLSLDVVEACSGLRSLESLVTLAVFYGYLFEPRASLRLLLVLSSIPIAVAANGFRIMGCGVLGEYWSPDKAEGFFHMFSGWLVFVFSLGLLVLFHKILGWFVPRPHSRPAQ